MDKENTKKTLFSKGDNNCKNYRRISILDLARKIYAKTLKCTFLRTIKQLTDEERIVLENDRSTRDGNLH